MDWTRRDFPPDTLHEWNGELNDEQFFRAPTVPLEFPDWNYNGIGLDSSTPNSVYAKPLPQLLSENGYHTIHAGKAHFGAIGYPSSNPLNLGFDINIAITG